MSVTLAEGRRLSRGTDRERKKPKGRKEVSRRQGYSQQSTPLMGSNHSSAMLLAQHSAINPWKFPDSLLHVQSWHSVCSCPDLLWAFLTPFHIQHHPKASELAQPPGMFVGHVTLRLFRQQCCSSGLQGWDLSCWGTVLREGYQQKNGMFPLLDTGTHLRCSAPRAVISAIWFIEQLLVLSRTTQADNYYLPGQAGASSKPPGLSTSLLLSSKLVPSAFSHKKTSQNNFPQVRSSIFVTEINILCYHLHTFVCSRCCV